jgi:FkbM family methyltransferase
MLYFQVAFGQPMTNLPMRLLTGSYSLVKRSGFLETSAGSHLFTSAYFLYKRYLEDHLRDLVRAYPGFLRGGNILDVGANLGYTARVLARSIDPGHHVYAFEPAPANFRILQRIAAQPRMQNRITPVQAAVGAREGAIELWLNMHHHADHRVITDRFRDSTSPMHRVSVPMVTIDGFLAQSLDQNPSPVSFCKIDVQGFELPVLQGMKSTLDRNPGMTIVLEYAPSGMVELGFDPAELLRFLAERHFDCFTVHPGGKLTPGAPSDMKDGAYVDLLFTRRPISSASSGHRA